MTTPEEITPVSTGEITGSESPGINPAWNEVLEVLPASLHSLVTPHFQKWDQSAQSRIEEVNTKFKDYESYSPLVEHGITMDQVHQAINLLSEINNNPRSIYDALDETFKYSQAQVDPNAVVPEAAGTVPDPNQYQVPPELQEQVNLLSQLVLSEQQAKAAQAEDAKLDRELGAALEKFPDVEMNKVTEDFVLAQMMTKNLTAEQAVQSFVDFRASVSPQPFAPRILSASGGGVPTQGIDPKTLSRSDTQSLVAQLLMQNKRQQG
jgi:hypothetical protein